VLVSILNMQLRVIETTDLEKQVAELVKRHLAEESEKSETREPSPDRKVQEESDKDADASEEETKGEEREG